MLGATSGASRSRRGESSAFRQKKSSTRAKMRGRRASLRTAAHRKFVALVAQHVPGHYRHSMRYFGLLAPTVKGLIAPAVFALSNSTRRPKPKRQSWAASVQKHFGRDPLKDANGQRMRWIGSLPPKRNAIIRSPQEHGLRLPGPSAGGRTPLSLSNSP